MSRSSSGPGLVDVQSPPTMSSRPGHGDKSGGLPRPSRKSDTPMGTPHEVGGPTSQNGHNTISPSISGTPSAVGGTSHPTSRQRSIVHSPGSSETITPVVDPLSRHILQRTGTEANVRVRKETLVEEQLSRMKDLSTSARSSPVDASPVLQRSQPTFPDTQPNSAQRSTQQQSPQSPQSQQHQSSPQQTQHSKRKVSSRSFLSRLIGIKGNETDSDDDSLADAGDRMEGNDVQAFSQPLEGKVSHIAPKYIRVRSKNVGVREFSHLFLAQELQTPEAASTQDADQVSTKGSIPASTSGSSSHNSGFKGAIWSLKFSQDGKYMACGGQDAIVWVWAVIDSPETRMEHEAEEQQSDARNTQKGTKLNAPVFQSAALHTYAGHSSDVLDLSWSKNNFLLSSSMDKTVRLWHVSRKECLVCFQHSDFVTSIAFHPLDDRYFLSGSLDCKLRLWSIPNKSVTYWNELPELITAIAFTPDGKYVVVGTFVGLCLFYETDNLRYHTQIHVRSTRGKNFKGHKITGIEARIIPPRKNHADTRLLITSNDSRVRVYNFRDKSLEIKFKGYENSSSQIRASFSDEGSYVICGSEDRQVYIWHTSYKSHVTATSSSNIGGYERFEAHSNVITAAVFAPTRSRQLLFASNDPIYELSHRALQSTGSLTPSSTNGTDSVVSSLSKVPSNTSQSSLPMNKSSKTSRSAASMFLDGQIIVCADSTGNIKVFRQDSAFKTRSELAEIATISKRTRNTRMSSNGLRPPDRSSWRDFTGQSVGLDQSLRSLSRPPSKDSLSLNSEPINKSDIRNNTGLFHKSVSSGRLPNTSPDHLEPAFKYLVRPPTASASNISNSGDRSLPHSDVKNDSKDSNHLKMPNNSKQGRAGRMAIQDNGASMAYYFPDNLSDHSESDEHSNDGGGEFDRKLSTISTAMSDDCQLLGSEDTKSGDMKCPICSSTTFKAFLDIGFGTTRLQCANCGHVMQ